MMIVESIVRNDRARLDKGYELARLRNAGLDYLKEKGGFTLDSNGGHHLRITEISHAGEPLFSGTEFGAMIVGKKGAETKQWLEKTEAEQDLPLALARELDITWHELTQLESLKRDNGIFGAIDIVFALPSPSRNGMPPKAAPPLKQRESRMSTEA